MTRRAILMALLAIACVTTFASESFAAAWTVYIYNVRRPYQGTYRAGISYKPSTTERAYTQVYTTEDECRKGIAARLKDNRKWRIDFEDFAIVKHNNRPPEGQLRSGYLDFKWVHRPNYGRYR